MNLENFDRVKAIKAAKEKLEDHLADVQKAIASKKEFTSVHINLGGDLLVLSQPNMPFPIKEYLYLYEQSITRKINQLTKEAFEL